MIREARNFQFDFLRPNHSLFGYFNRLIEQYTRVLYPPRELLAKIALHATPEGKWDMLAEARERAAYVRWRREREKKKEDDKEAERSKCEFHCSCICLLTVHSRIRRN